MARTSASSRPLTDHDQIRRWAEERGATPSCVRGTGHNNDVGMIRLDFPGYSGEGKLEEISWDEWFDKFDESGLALLVQEKTARGQQSNFNKLVSRETAGFSGRSVSGRDKSSSNSGSKGRRNTSRNNGFENEEEYESSAEAINDQGTDEDLEEETLVEQASPTRARSTGTSRSRTRQARTTGRQASRNSRIAKASRRSGARTTRSRKQKNTKSRSSSNQRGRAAAARKSSNVRSRNSRSSRSTARKAPSRTSTSNPRSSRSSSRKRAA
jgi:hypothetical protein